ncbi:hypothetical protein TWF718_005401 [Orbilia javanica]|uniref:Uncharacterized protein n=1 Tax=Orbilia javanica TaxID=47235 RepID=A0AAN8N3J3_9PEZI
MQIKSLIAVAVVGLSPVVSATAFEELVLPPTPILVALMAGLYSMLAATAVV